VRDKPIRLVACSTGARNGSFAQELANELGIPVMAPSEILELRAKGRIVIAPVHPFSTALDTSRRGGWVKFVPTPGLSNNAEGLPVTKWRNRSYNSSTKQTVVEAAPRPAKREKWWPASVRPQQVDTNPSNDDATHSAHTAVAGVVRPRRTAEDIAKHSATSLDGLLKGEGHRAGTTYEVRTWAAAEQSMIAQARDARSKRRLVGATDKPVRYVLWLADTNQFLTAKVMSDETIQYRSYDGNHSDKWIAARPGADRTAINSPQQDFWLTEYGRGQPIGIVSATPSAWLKAKNQLGWFKNKVSGWSRKLTGAFRPVRTPGAPLGADPSSSAGTQPIFHVGGDDTSESDSDDVYETDDGMSGSEASEDTPLLTLGRRGPTATPDPTSEHPRPGIGAVTTASSLKPSVAGDLGARNAAFKQYRDERLASLVRPPRMLQQPFKSSSPEVCR
jgi:hypothetical protein